MNVYDAVAARHSVRAFLDKAIPRELVEELLNRAVLAPSGGNLQPWHVHALTGEPLRQLVEQVAAEPLGQEPGYEIYPPSLHEPFRTRRFAVGEALYATLSIAREDKEARLRQLSSNSAFFGAPVGIFVLVERRMGPPQWADLGIYIQTLLLLATEAGLGSCAQEYWTMHAATVERFLGVPEDQMVFCGIALGYEDTGHPIHSFRTTRAPTSEWRTLHGFSD